LGAYDYEYGYNGTACVPATNCSICSDIYNDTLTLVLVSAGSCTGG
jgi:hypothetical protein